MKQYITYTRVRANDNLYLDPNTNDSFENATKDSKFNETPYGKDWVFLASVEYPDTTTQEEIDGLILAYKEFEFTFISEEQANLLLKWIDELISVSNFKFTDNRPLDII